MEELPQAKLKPITPFVREGKDELPGGLKLFPLVKKKRKKKRLFGYFNKTELKSFSLQKHPSSFTDFGVATP